MCSTAIHTSESAGKSVPMTDFRGFGKTDWISLCLSACVPLKSASGESLSCADAGIFLGIRILRNMALVLLCVHHRKCHQKSCEKA
jgi:hypothetical protein